MKVTLNYSLTGDEYHNLPQKNTAGSIVAHTLQTWLNNACPTPPPAPQPNGRLHQWSTRVPTTVADALTSHAARLGVSRNALVRRILIAEQEDPHA